MDIIKTHKKILRGDMSIDELENIKSYIHEDFKRGIKGELSDAEMESLIRILIDYYVYNSEGDVLITDSEYDSLMKEWTRRGHELITTADDLNMELTTWPMVEHRAPWMVGSLRKIYTQEEIDAYIEKVLGKRYYQDSGISKTPQVTFVVAPKYDGTSCYIEVRNGEPVFAATRGDGTTGQDMLQVIKHTRIYKNGEFKHLNDGFIKCELVMSTKYLDELREETGKPYRNRRSATSGIINSPKNVELAKYIWVITLAHYNSNTGEVVYFPPGSRIIKSDNVHELTKMVNNAIRDVRDECQNPDFEFRTDGVVLYPLELSNGLSGDANIMEESIAFKFNGAEGRTYVEDVYVSIGRLGGATPVAKVRPVDVNETTVTDISLSNFDKFEKMDLHYGQEVIVFSAGDVIPQIRLPKKPKYPEGAKKIKVKKVCPYCDHDLVQDKRQTKENSSLKEKGKLWRCNNPKCPRVVSGRIANFISRVGGESIADKTVDLLYMSKRIRDIVDLLNITYSDVIDLEGFSDVSATLLEEEIKRIRTKETKASDLLSALGIQGIGPKTSKLILSRVPLKKLLKMKRGEIVDEILELDGIGIATAEKFADYIKENKDEIKDIVDLMNISNESYIRFGNVAFTGFRSTEWENKFNDINIDVDDSVNKDTIAVFAEDLYSNSSKLKKARRYNIPIYERSKIDLVYEHLRKIYSDSSKGWNKFRDEYGNMINPLFD